MSTWLLFWGIAAALGTVHKSQQSNEPSQRSSKGVTCRDRVKTFGPLQVVMKWLMLQTRWLPSGQEVNVNFLHVLSVCCHVYVMCALNKLQLQEGPVVIHVCTGPGGPQV